MNMQTEVVSNQYEEVIPNTKGNQSNKTYKSEVSHMVYRMKELWCSDRTQL